MNKLSKYIVGIALSLCGLGSVVGTGIAVSSATANNKAVPAEAANTGSKGDTIFFTPSDHWSEAGATFKLQWYKNGSYVGSTFMDVYSNSTVNISTRTTYYAQTGAAFDAIQILRFNPSKSQEWNHSGNSGVSGENRWLYMDPNSSWSNDWYVGDSGSKTTWRLVDAVILKTEQTPTANTVRLFVYNSGSHFNPAAIRAWGVSASPSIVGNVKTDGTIYLLNWFADIDDGASESGATWYGYADIPTDVSGFNVINCGVQDSYDAYLNYGSYDSWTVDNAYGGIFYCSTEAYNNTVTLGDAHDKTCNAALMRHILESIDVCSDSSQNGYNAYGNIYNHYYKYANEDKMKIRNFTPDDWGTSEYNPETVSIYDHMAGMASRSGYSASRINFFPTASANDSTGVIVIVSTIAVAATAGFFFIRKKRV